MTTYKKTVLLTVVFIALVILIAKPYFKQQNTTEFFALGTLTEKYNYMVQEKPVTLIVLSYDADCCASTQAFFERYNQAINDIIENSSQELYTLYIDYAALSKEDEDVFNTLVEAYNLKTLPSLVLINRKGKILTKTEGPFNKEDLLRHIKEAL
jgi:hypothetical protein